MPRWLTATSMCLALTNVRRHAGARSVLVSVATQEGKLYAEVSDDGVSFDAAQEPLATTTGGMRERARALGGDLERASRGGARRYASSCPCKEREEPEIAVRALRVDDHAAIREALASAFEQEGGFEIAGQTGSLEEARRVLEDAGRMDVAVVDLGLPDGHRGDLIKELREANPQAQALALSASLDRGEIARAVEAGAAGVLSKTAHLDEVVEAVRRLRAGETLMPLEEVIELLRFASSRREQ
jgi:CheY-like chemotaxis protein